MNPYRDNNRHRRRFAVAVSASLLSLTAAGTSSAGAAAAPVTITILGAESTGSFTADIAAFEKANPGVKIVYDLFPGNFDTAIIGRMKTHDSSYSIYTVDEPRLPQDAASGWLLPITSPSATQLDTLLLPEQVNEVSYNGKVYGLPQSTSSQVMYYNKGLLSKAGVTPPAEDPASRWTWSQIYNAGLKVVKATGKSGLLFEQANTYYQLEPLSAGLGGGSGVTGPNGLTPDVDNAAWLQAMDWYSKLFSTGLTPKSATPQNTSATFEAGGAAFFIGGLWDYYPFLHTKGLSFGVAPHPYWGAGHPAVTPTDAWALGLNPYAPKSLVPEALKFIEYLTLNTQGAKLQMGSSADFGTTGPGNPPANLVLLKNFYYNYFPSAMDSLIKYELAKTGFHRARTLGYAQFETTMDQTYLTIADGVSPAKALALAQSELKSEFGLISSGA
jgi:multiple sugar transport system substrate-binding protein